MQIRHDDYKKINVRMTERLTREKGQLRPYCRKCKKIPLNKRYFVATLLLWSDCLLEPCALND